MNIPKVLKIQHEFVSMVQSHFGKAIRAYFDSGLAIDDYLDSGVLGDTSSLVLPGNRSSVEYKVEAFRNDVRWFWSAYTAELISAIGRDSKLAIMIPTSLEIPQLARKLSLIFDTIFIADPIANFAIADIR
jgi:hypothetical protein